MRQAGSAYLLGAVAATAAHAASALAGFASLFLLNRLVGKEGLGGYAFAMAAVLLAGSLATLGLDRALLLRIAQRPPRGWRLRGRALAARAALAAFGAGVALAALLAGAAGWSGRLDPVAADSDCKLRKVQFRDEKGGTRPDQGGMMRLRRSIIPSALSARATQQMRPAGSQRPRNAIFTLFLDRLAPRRSIGVASARVSPECPRPWSPPTLLPISR